MGYFTLGHHLGNACTCLALLTKLSASLMAMVAALWLQLLHVLLPGLCSVHLPFLLWFLKTALYGSACIISILVCLV